MAACWCSLAGTAACQHCQNNPMAVDVWMNKPNVAVDHIDAKPFGNGHDVCPVCGKPTTIGKPKTKADRIRAMSDEELADKFEEIQLQTVKAYENDYLLLKGELKKYWLDWMRQEAEDGE